MANPTRQRCGARLRRSNPPRHCQQFPIKGRRRCRLHGGLTPTGTASPHWKHGRHSKALPKNLEALYEAFRQDPDLVTLSDETALVDVRIGMQLEQLHGEHVDLMQREPARDAMQREHVERIRAMSDPSGRKLVVVLGELAGSSRRAVEDVLHLDDEHLQLDDATIREVTESVIRELVTEQITKHTGRLD